MRSAILVTIAVALIPVAVFGYGLGDVTGGGEEFDTSSIDSLLVDIQEVADLYTGYHEKLVWAKEALQEVADVYGFTNIYEDVDTLKEAREAVEMTQEHMDLVKDVVTLVQRLPENLQICLEEAIGLVPKIPTAIADLTQAIADNPMGATKLTGLKDRLGEGQTNLETIVSEAPGIVEESGKVAVAASALVY